MAQDSRPFRSGALALLLLAGVIFAAGVWTQINLGSSDPAVTFVVGAVLPHVEDNLPAFMGQSETPFGTFAKMGSVLALAGLLLFTLRRRAPLAATPAAHPMPRVVPRRPSTLRSARTNATATGPTAAPTMADHAPPAPPATGRVGQRLHRVALMLVGSVLIGVGAFWFIGRANLPVPAFTPPGGGLPSIDTDTLKLVMIGLGASLGLFAALRMLRRRRVAA